MRSGGAKGSCMDLQWQNLSAPQGWQKVTVRYEEDLHKFNHESARVNLDIYVESDPAIATSEDESSPNRGSCYSVK